MKIVMLNPPFLNRYSKSSRSPGVGKSGTIYFPLWLSYATGVLDKEGHEVKIIDAPAKNLSIEDTLKKVVDFKPELVVIDTSTPSIYSDLEFAKLIRSKCQTVKICLVGTHATSCVHEILPECSAFVDFIARHEYDYTIRELVTKLNDSSKYRNIKGISFCENGEVIDNEDREYIENLDELPFVSEVYKKHLDIRDYFYAHVSFPTISFFASRGCPSRCFYCMYSQVMFGKAYRHRSAKSIYEECKYIKDNYPEVKGILIDDDNFTVDQDNVKEFCKLMIDNDINLTWTVQVRVNLKYETMVQMKKDRMQASSCRTLRVGIKKFLIICTKVLNLKIHFGLIRMRIEQRLEFMVVLWLEILARQ